MGEGGKKGRKGREEEEKGTKAGKGRTRDRKLIRSDASRKRGKWRPTQFGQLQYDFSQLTPNMRA